MAVLALATAAATAGTLGLTAGPAWAHICPVPAEIAVGPTATIAVGVTVEGTAVSDVAIMIPDGLRLVRVDAKAGWKVERTGATLRYRGGPIPTYKCEYFSLGVSAPTAGTFGIPVVQRAADGRVVARSTPDPTSVQSRALDQFVYAGVKPPASGSGSGGSSTTTLAGLGLAGLGVVLVGVLVLRAWQSRRDGGPGDGEPDRDSELEARLEQFRKRAPDPPPEA